MNRKDPVYVYADWRGLGGPTLMGELHRSVGQYFRLSKSRQAAIIDEVVGVTNTWEKRAQSMKLKRSETELLRRAFRNAK